MLWAWPLPEQKSCKLSMSPAARPRAASMLTPACQRFIVLKQLHNNFGTHIASEHHHGCLYVYNVDLSTLVERCATCGVVGCESESTSLSRYLCICALDSCAATAFRVRCLKSIDQSLILAHAKARSSASPQCPCQEIMLL